MMSIAAWRSRKSEARTASCMDFLRGYAEGYSIGEQSQIIRLHRGGDGNTGTVCFPDAGVRAEQLRLILLR